MGAYSKSYGTCPQTPHPKTPKPLRIDLILRLDYQVLRYNNESGYLINWNRYSTALLLRPQQSRGHQTDINDPTNILRG